jgi:hypothetical protein
MAGIALSHALEPQGIDVTPYRRLAARGLIACATLLMLLAVAVFISRSLDEKLLSTVAGRIVSSSKAPSDRAIAILHFVYNDEGFLKNRGYFIFPQFGPTSVQVLAEGGDCADKSRLMVALLRHVGIKSTPVMLFDNDMRPTHTVVEADVENGPMEMDPVYDLYFPKTGGGFYGSAELRGNPQVLPTRLEWMGLSDWKARHYHLDRSNYSHAATFNWEKYWFTREAKSILLRFYGDRVYQLRRPEIIEDPKLLTATALGTSGIALFLVLALSRISAARNTRLAELLKTGAPS